MKRNLVVAAILSQPWALMPEYMQGMASIVARWQAGVAPSAESLETVRADMAAREARAAAANAAVAGGAIAVINCFGVCTQRGNMMDELCGGGSMSMEGLVSQLRAAERDETVGAILLNINSPGGSVYGVQEAGDEIARIKGAKPIFGFVNSLCASAAYWLAAQCSELYCTPGGEVGSIGVWQAHQDVSVALEQEGVKINLISAGKYKVEGNPYAPLDEDARGFMQQRTNEYYQAFTKAVAKGRGVPVSKVTGGMGQGRVLGPKQAQEEQMIDGVATFDEVVKKLQRASRSAGRAASAIIPAEPTASAQPVVTINVNSASPEAADQVAAAVRAQINGGGPTCETPPVPALSLADARAHLDAERASIAHADRQREIDLLEAGS